MEYDTKNDFNNCHGIGLQVLIYNTIPTKANVTDNHTHYNI